MSLYVIFSEKENSMVGLTEVDGAVAMFGTKSDADKYLELHGHDTYLDFQILKVSVEADRIQNP